MTDEASRMGSMEGKNVSLEGRYKLAAQEYNSSMKKGKFLDS